MTIPQQTFVLPPLPNLHVYPTRKRYDNFLPIGNWTKEEDELLQKLISQDSLNVCNENNRNKKKQWHQIANYFKDKTPQQIMNHWNKVINPTLVKGNWSREEDQLLIKWVNEHGERGWTKIAAQLPGRVGKQCRERWINCLNPSIRKTEWTEDEDSIIISMQEKIGNKWSKIAEVLPGRSDNQIKNRWNSTLKRRIQAVKTDQQNINNLSGNQTVQNNIDTENIDFFNFDQSIQMENKGIDEIFGSGNSWFDESETNNQNSIFSSSHDIDLILNDDSWMEKDR
ncbi:hypothetical protein M9Y10_009636 [Tritrichomonas musculus]|uniref:Myb-like DNA-binding domain containing protein n=1 Tax=Tritrichomonas musculus TaxID=1915356 RepID=A0ABR2IQ34_9EUKA